MNTLKGTADLIFVSANKGEKSKASGKPYNFVELSNGLSSKLFRAPKDFDNSESGFKKGEEVTVHLEVDIMKDNFNITITDIQTR